MSPDFLVRDARPEDVPQAARCGADLVRWHHELDPARFAILADPIEPGYARYLHARLRDPGSVVLVVELLVPSPLPALDEQAGEQRVPRAHESTIVGYAFGQLEPPNWADLLDTAGRMHDLWVDPPYRRTGMGRELVRALVDRLRQRGAARLVLSTAWNNTTARALFASFGFRPTMVEMTCTAGASDRAAAGSEA